MSILLRLTVEAVLPYSLLLIIINRTCSADMKNVSLIFKMVFASFYRLSFIQRPKEYEKLIIGLFLLVSSILVNSNVLPPARELNNRPCIENQNHEPNFSS